MHYFIMQALPDWYSTSAKTDMTLDKWRCVRMSVASIPTSPLSTDDSNDCILPCRTRALTRLESQLASHLSELQYLCGASSQLGIPDESQTREVEDLWKETTKAVTER